MITVGGTDGGVNLKVKTLTKGSVERFIVDKKGGNEYVDGTEVVAVNTYLDIYGDGSYNGTEFEGFKAGDAVTTDRGKLTAISTLELVELKTLTLTSQAIDNQRIPYATYTVGGATTYGTISGDTGQWPLASGTYDVFIRHNSVNGTAPYYNVSGNVSTGYLTGYVLSLIHISEPTRRRVI